ncbi:MAG: type IX secretion system outer membrane channel protein PorV [Prevotellaceae bacterium]|nr:type IX secretion system outer membrane channel protein PorV [Prevotellaceae bacterium]
MKRIIILLTLLSLVVGSVFAQEADNPIVFAMPVLTVVPDARASGMGDMGVATLPTTNDQHWNASKYVFNEAKSGVSLSYIPWLRGIGTSNINLLYLTGFYRIDNKQAIGASLRYFSLGAMTFWGEQQEFIKSSNPNEMAIDVSYSRLLGEYFSAGVAFRYLRSDITGGSYNSGTVFQPANAWSADIGFYYNEPIRLGAMTGVVSAGLSITNIGSKMNYGYAENEARGKTYFLPTTGRLGGNLKLDLDYYNELSFGVELNKYLVPTPPRIEKNEVTGEDEIVAGKDNNVSMLKGMIQSFYDAPGGFKEELKEIVIGIGAEYTYSRVFSVRGGYYYDYKWPQHKYATLGAGIIYYMFSFDVSYLIPVVAGLQSPLANTLHLTLSIDFGKSMRRRTFANN